jgi:hypothetical protein
MTDLITIIVTELRPLGTDDGDLSKLIVRDPQSRAEKSMVLSAIKIRDLLADCLVAEQVDVVRSSTPSDPSGDIANFGSAAGELGDFCITETA